MTKPTKKKQPEAAKALRDRALALPGAWEDSPWGDSVVKAGKKIFVFLGEEKITLKLVEAHPAAMSIPGAAPTAYGLGKAGWVTLPREGAPPLDVLCDWLEESYRLVAPKKLIKELDARG
jgi:predicted DNA-binding protein (MmcQ/YjbR family)